MAVIEHSSRVYEFGPFHLVPGERQLLRDDHPVPLTPKAFATLLVLVEKSGHLVGKDELIERVWNGIIVEEAGLARNISSLRKALGESPHEQRYIETVTGYGYRFIAGVKETCDEPASRPDVQSDPPSLIEQMPARPGGEATNAKTAVALLPASRFRSRRTTVLALALIPALIGIAAFLFLRGPSKQAESGSGVKSLAVLPFKAMAAEGGQELLGLGMADALITKLGNIGGINILPTSAIRSYAQADQNPALAGQSLKVDSVLEGSIQRSGDKVRVSVQLIRTSDGTALWADKFDGQFSDIFSMQDSISEQVARALMLRLSSEEKRRLNKRFTENTEAYQHYLKGQHYWNKRTSERLEKGIEQFQQAIDKDPGYALAYVGLAESYAVLSFYGDANPKESFPKAKAAAASALQIDETLGEAHASLGIMHLVYDWDWPLAEKEFKRALELNPNYANAWHWYGWYLTAEGRFDEAAAKFKRAQELDPLSQIIGTNLGEMYYYARQYDQAIEQLQKTLEIEPTFAQAHLDLGRSYLQKGDFSRAIAEMSQARAISGGTAMNSGILGYAYAVSGQREQAQQLLGEMKEMANRRYVPSYYVALIYVGLGEKDQAFQWLGKAREERSEKRLTLKVDPMLDSLRSDPRFTALLRDVRFAP